MTDDTETDPIRDALYERLFDELDQAEESSQVADLVFAAFDGADALNEALGGITTPRPQPTRRPRSHDAQIPGMYLKSISVRGFRGVGPMTTLNLSPGPGLTLITGRNGSGKSSFADAVELALTETNDRLDRGKIWKDGWLNLHREGAPRIEVELTAEGARRPIKVARAWQAADTDLLAAKTTVRLPGEAARPLSELPWQEALSEYRPILAYSELTGLITDGNAKNFDAIDRMLQLGDLGQIHNLLRQTRLELDRARKAVAAGMADLLAELSASTDERATVIRTSLASKVARLWDLDAAYVAAGGAAAADANDRTANTVGAIDTVGAMELDDEATALGRLLALDLPEPSEVAERAANLRAAVARVKATSGTPAADARRVAGLLRTGLDHYREHGGGSCPLCRVGTLDEAWRASATEEAERLHAIAEDANDANNRLGHARGSALALIQESPRALAADRVPGSMADSAARARAAWDAWERLRAESDSGTLADDLVVHHQNLLSTLGALRSAARTRLETLETAWSPLARRTLEWVDAARVSRARQPLLKALKNAEDFIRRLLEHMQDERLEPFATQHAEIWADLRQESNIEIGRLKLRGTGTQRRPELDVTVDGAGGKALGVMSQGELHALGLALFLPRATVPESPFRFVVIDDPVQSMDPAKVDGLARVLLRTARTRQVVVFSHDDRLADAVRRFSTPEFPARQLEVVRGEQSVIEIKSMLDPASRWLDEARALAHTPNLPEDIRSALVSGFCRSAVDAVCIDIYRRKRLAAGDRHHEVEDAITATKGTGSKAALAIFEDAKRAPEVLGYINNRWKWQTGDIYKAVVKDSGHGPRDGDATALVRDARVLVNTLSELR
ncbi:AAA family ATPase [Frankia sp. QA3]|uniref:AAA family ATPase n=1 Tax=Frankia sp. QA3 TaxID=710111 RepID=UPI000269C7A8|nr:AAA family ATPase [Frankia sp. QA3]EIV94545.1 hypothetical protein FraQA3DRAFT_4302 [Frankia sp. QA3]